MVLDLIEHKKGADWEFVFLGANIDASATASRSDITDDRTGTNLNCKVMNETVATFGQGNKIDKS